jgi:hypothetical protein
MARAQTIEPIPIGFGNFFRYPVGQRGLELSDTLRGADGQRVVLRGYMVAQERPFAGRFLFTPRPVRLSEDADGDADDLPPATVTVLLDDSQRDRVVPHRDGLISLVGRLEVGRADDDGGRVSWFRLVLDSNAVTDADPASASLIPNSSSLLR